MQTNKAIVALGIVGVIGTSLLLAGGSFGKDGRHGGGGPDGGGCLMQDINLTNDQQTQLEQLRQELHTNMVALHDGYTTSPMETAIESGSFDQDAFIKVETERFGEMVNLKASYMEEMYNVLTDDQKTQFAENVASDDCDRPGPGGF